MIVLGNTYKKNKTCNKTHVKEKQSGVSCKSYVKVIKRLNQGNMLGKEGMDRKWLEIIKTLWLTVELEVGKQGRGRCSS